MSNEQVIPEQTSVQGTSISRRIWQCLMVCGLRLFIVSAFFIWDAHALTIAEIEAEVKALGGKIETAPVCPKWFIKKISTGMADWISKWRAVVSIEVEGRVEHTHLIRWRKLRWLTYLHVTNPQFTDADLTHLSQFSMLECLSLRTNLTDKGSPNLQTLKNLKSIFLTIDNTDDAGLVQLRGLTNLKCLQLDNTHVTGAGFYHLADLNKLSIITLRGTPLTDAGLKDLCLVTNLEILELAGTPITDAGLENLEKMTNLRWLDLGGTKITDDGLIHVSKATNINYLELNQTNITNNGLKNFIKMTKLNTLSVGHMRISQVAIDDFQKKRPDVKVTRNIPPGER